MNKMIKNKYTWYFFIFIINSIICSNKIDLIKSPYVMSDYQKHKLKMQQKADMFQSIFYFSFTGLMLIAAYKINAISKKAEDKINTVSKNADENIKKLNTFLNSPETNKIFEKIKNLIPDDNFDSYKIPPEKITKKTLADLVSPSKNIENVKKNIINKFTGKSFESLDKEKKNGILFYGPAGTGKTEMAYALINEINKSDNSNLAEGAIKVPYVGAYEVSMEKITSIIPGESASKIKSIYDNIKKRIDNKEFKYGILILDESGNLFITKDRLDSMPAHYAENINLFLDTFKAIATDPQYKNIIAISIANLDEDFIKENREKVPMLTRFDPSYVGYLDEAGFKKLITIYTKEKEKDISTEAEKNKFTNFQNFDFGVISILNQYAKKFADNKVTGRSFKDLISKIYDTTVDRENKKLIEAKEKEIKTIIDDFLKNLPKSSKLKAIIKGTYKHTLGRIFG